MNPSFSAAEEAFRQEARIWLIESLRSVGYDAMSWRERLDTDFCMRWERHMGASGWTGLSWPKEYGGRALPLVQQVIFQEEYARAEAPILWNSMAHGILAPTLMYYGTESQKKRFLPGILSNEERWCQGYSEPGAGSDLAALATRAERISDARGDRYVVTGQKVWTSVAQFAHWCFILVRSDPKSSRHKGISFLLLDMKSRGVTVRPLRQMTGESEFNEVFFDGVEVPVENRVGEEGQGWEIAMTAANHERGTFFVPMLVSMQSELRDLVKLARTTPSDGRPAIEDPLIQDKLAQLYMDVSVMRLNSYRTLETLMQGRPPGPEASFTKLFWSEVRQRMLELAMDILGPQAMLAWTDPQAAAGGRWQREHLWSRAITILAATSEIHRNIIAERGLGMPR